MCAVTDAAHESMMKGAARMSHQSLDMSSTVILAAQYVRMSTEHQQYSTENQRDVIRDYAIKRNYKIIQTYADDGRSGLRIEGRGALQQMIADVQSDEATYKAILVYDISRWGRFQDTDESAYYEYICKRAGIQVIVRSNLRTMGLRPRRLSKA
jgi:DNA invertase Pin-like site-specific DNA recombinase